MDPTKLDNLSPVSVFPFIGKIVEQMVGTQLQKTLDEGGYQDPLQSAFRPDYSTGTVLMALMGDL